MGRALRAKVRVWTQDRAMGDAARADIERALALEPDLPEALAARGLYYTYVSGDPERGLADLTRAIAHRA